VSPWVLRGLREGVVTTRWPSRPDSYAESWRGLATVLDPHPAGAADLAALCPTSAISSAADASVRLDQGQCILCGRCVTQRPDAFGWSRGPGNAALTRDRLVTPQIPETEQSLAATRAGLRARTAMLRRSVHLRHVDAGSDGAEEQEILALLNPVYDVHRLGIFFTACPRHADVLLVTGAGAHGMAEPLRRTFEGMPSPKAVIAVGSDACGGGLLAGSYATSGGVGAVVPVDVWLPGSPPPPFSILHALLLALGRLKEANQ
jgi:Ni,Fe-hydrogenase III small subunit/ferredoxin